MRILLAIAHFWDPNGDGKHQSLRPNPFPRLEALKHQLLCLRRQGEHQSQLHVADRMVYPANQALRHEIDICLVTDGEHTVIEQLEPLYRGLFEEVVTEPPVGLELGFEAQAYLGSQVDKKYDFYGYMEDDLLIHDPLFFQKLVWFQNFMGQEALLLPQRVELAQGPHFVDRFYIDGPLPEDHVKPLVDLDGPLVMVAAPGGDVPFEPPRNPHAGCFFLSHSQLRHWMEQPHWLDRDSSFISPLESAATLGISRSFNLYKPSLSHASWLEIQHWGTSFHSLIAAPQPEVEEELEDVIEPEGEVGQDSLAELHAT
ncbi:hypothetical protein [Prochlorococcus sp. MIT 1300]|uniref:hypothetical protein n=1 Tax=Prochlorococcus sp. MIT 1300 TaxID=3096218 RepID=UPI002A75A710|nr:hypothetical protein [Prochlorococcus sp. MIT 1300]